MVVISCGCYVEWVDLRSVCINYDVKLRNIIKQTNIF